jgi:DNA-binding transcriptional regulator YhcF (GntR family)
MHESGPKPWGFSDDGASSRSSVLDDHMAERNLKLITGTLDRSLPVPIGTQLRGLIRYGISSGALARGARLPSIKDIADASGLAPMTVASAYRSLRETGLIVTRPGAGTYVAESEVEWAERSDAMRRVEDQVDTLLAQARGAELSIVDIVGILHARATGAGRAKKGQDLHIVMVGLFGEATQAYAQDLAPYCAPGDRLEAITFDALRETLSVSATPDLYVSLVSLRHEVATLVGRRAPVASIGLIPSERTRASLASIDPNARLCIVSAFADFLALMKPSVLRFAPHLRDVEVALIDSPDLGLRLAGCDAVVYSTGADAILGKIDAGTHAIEYRHVPDPHSLKQTFVPLVAELRAARLREGAFAP